MLYERFFESKTKGIIQGSSILNSELPNGSSGIYDPNPARGCPWNHKEFFFDEDLIDTRKTNNLTKHGSFINWKIVIKSRETGEIIWVRPFLSKSEAFVVWARLLNLDLERVEQNGGMQYCPTVYNEGDLVYEFATVESFTSTGSTTWTAPTRVRSVQYVVVAGGGSGSRDSQFAGAGGAGGYRSNVSGESSGGGASAEPALSVTAGSGYTVTVGTGGSNPFGSAGTNSVFSSITSVGGGRGGGQAPSLPNAGGSGGSGGGAHESSNSGGSGTPGQGYGGGGGQPNEAGGGGGGAGQSGASGGNTAAGGNGVASSITGSSVYRAGGGGGAKRNTQPSGGSGGGGYGSRQSPGSNAQPGTPNTGGGGGGGGGNYTAGLGGSGIVILSYTPVQNVQINLPMLGM